MQNSFFAIGILIGVLQPANAAAPAPPQLTANHPAARWDHAYPVGNGTLGGMSFGAFPDERIVLNNDTIWSRPNRVELPPGCRTNDMAEAFALAMQGDYAAAQAAYCRAKNKGNSIATFQCLGAFGDFASGRDEPARHDTTPAGFAVRRVHGDRDARRR